MKTLITDLKMTNKTSLLVIFISFITYYFFAYHTPRTNYTQVLCLYTLAFINFYFLYKHSQLTIKWLIITGVIFRFMFIGAIPNLSNDFYRFLWDGRLILNNINPYLVLPENNPQLINNGLELYKGMGKMNGSHFTCYPPLNQFAFSIPAIVSQNGILTSTIVMRLSLIIADIITVFFTIKILNILKINSKKVLLYFINPFIIIELTGNLHYEGLMIAFFSASIYYLLKNKNNISAVLYACAISIKLIPLIFLPVFYKKLGFKKTLIYGCISLLVNFLLFIPFISTALYSNFMSSIELYFQNFEFNASFYYIIREIGYWVKGYNIIQTVGKITPIIVILFTLSITFVRKNYNPFVLIESMLFVIVFYYSLSSIVHPWYITIPLFLSIFTKFNFPVLWSFVVVFSYSAYVNQTYKENLWWVGLEYLLLFTFLVLETIHLKKNKLNESS